ncbi:hypothetical protein HQ34_01855 [Porphyromonas cangingivalis]|nr:hypothetical protein HQ34_01855 [Porphyromonas cangingivalis]
MAEQKIYIFSLQAFANAHKKSYIANIRTERLKKINENEPCLWQQKKAVVCGVIYNFRNLQKLLTS